MFKLSTTGLLMASMFTLSVVSVQAGPPAEKWVAGQILVKGKAGLSDEQMEKILGKARGRSVGKLSRIGTHIVQVPPQAEEAVIRALQHNPHIDYAEKDMLVELSAVTPNDPNYGNQWFLPLMGAPEAWDTTAGEGITVAILDTGVEAGHPDLADRLVPGWNVVSNNSDTSPIMWHGTSVAGTVAAAGNNGTGVASVAWNARIMPVRITNRSDGVASWSAMADGFIWAADNGADVANLSYGLSTVSSTINNAAQYLRNKGGLAVAASGNNNTDRGFGGNPHLITVSATTSSDARASYSNYGDNIDIAAPGSSIHTTYTGGGYKSVSGTSFASPAASGVVALIMAANPNLNPDEVEGVLKSSAVDLGQAGWDPLYGHGRVDAASAVQLATQGSGEDVKAPTLAIVTPGDGATVSGNVPVDVDASDNNSVSEVVLYVNGQAVGSDRTAPFQFSWDSAQQADGDATLTAYAYDAAGNAGISAAVSVQVDNQQGTIDNTPPTVSIQSPGGANTGVSGTVTVTVDATDDTGVSGVVLYANGKIIGTDSSRPFEFNWDTRQFADGDVILKARAYDAASNMGQSAGVTVTVDNTPDAVDTTPPLVRIDNPADGNSVSGRISITASASDNVGVTRIQVYIDKRLQCSADDVNSLNCNWNTRKLVGSSRAIRAVAWDAAGQSSETSITVSVVSGSNDGNSNKGKGKNK